MRITVLLLIVMFLAVPQQGLAAQDAALGAGVAMGQECRAPSTEADHELNVPALPEGDRLGSDDSIPARQSISVVPVALNELLNSGAALIVLDDERIVACGDIGGVRDEADQIGFGIREISASGVSGAAFIGTEPTNDWTTVFLFIVGPPIVQEAPTPTPAATATPEPPPPTSTPAPPASTSTVAAIEPSMSESEYIATMIDSSEEIANSLQRATEVMNTGGVSVLIDTTLQQELRDEFAIWDEQYDLVRRITPPSAFAASHELVVEAYGLMVASGEDVERAFVTFSPDDLNAGTDKMNQATRLLEEAVELLPDPRTR